MIPVTQDIRLDEDELQFRFVLASGPGGQNVNKVATAVQLRFDAARSRCLPDEVRTRLLALAGSRATKEGEVLITARRFRTQERNREDAVERLVTLIRRAAARPRPRRKTRPSRAAKQRRLDTKRRQKEKKRRRGPIDRSD